MARYDFLVETYATERLKTLSIWSQVPDDRMRFRPEPRARSPLEHMVHQCLSEDGWMRSMLGLTLTRPAVPAEETRLAFIEHYAACSEERHDGLTRQAEPWFEERAAFFDVLRTRAWILTRRIAHSAHHRGQLSAYLRMWGNPLYSTYGPTADTGGLPRNGASTLYWYSSLADLLDHERRGGARAPFPAPGPAAVVERPDTDG